jgi:hypothetical protein
MEMGRDRTQKRCLDCAIVERVVSPRGMGCDLGIKIYLKFKHILDSFEFCLVAAQSLESAKSRWMCWPIDTPKLASSS